ncbi:MAG TPA: dihydrolipoamide acetyltransferase family protein [Casimicrobiaceae bacterium]|nr:dihydrolipoamide acetyltransferase family protein [Casimicrobiaceae bacterium]
MIEFRLPSLGAEMDEGTLLEWKVKPGDIVRKGDVVAVVDTSKSAIDVEIWNEGTIYELALEPQRKVPVGTVMARLLEPGESVEHAEAHKRRLLATQAGPTAVAAAVPAAVGEGSIAAVPVPPPAASPAAAAPGAGRRRVSPAARMRAQALGLDPAGVTGTGPDGAVTLDDVERAARAIRPAQAAAAAAAMAPHDAARPSATDRALAMRGAIAAAMARSKRDIPHYYLAADIPLLRLRQWLAARNERRPVTGRVLMAVPLLKAVALALRGFPELNGRHVDGAFAPATGIHPGVAVSLRQGGLIAPAIHDADTLAIDDLMRHLADLVARARALTLRSSEMTDATITVTNLGEQGVELVQGIIYPPQVALVGFGRVTDRPWIDNGQVTVVPVVTASLAADHRTSDGHRGALFLNEIGRLLQDPGLLDGAAG